MKHFSDTIAADIATSVSINFTGKVIDELDESEKLDLLDFATTYGREELIFVILSMLPAEFRLPAVAAYDQTRHRTFHQTTASQIASEVSNRLYGKAIDKLDHDTQIILLKHAGLFGKEEFVSVIVSLLPVHLRLTASDTYDAMAKTPENGKEIS